MKSPFAAHETKTYTYPAPMERDHELVDADVLAAIEKGEDAPWLTLRIPRSAADVDAAADYVQSVVNVADGNGDGGTLQQRIARGNRGLFDLLVEGWSFSERKPTGDDYARLGGWAATWARMCLGDAHRLGTEADWGKKVSDSSTSPEISPETSTAESATA